MSPSPVPEFKGHGIAFIACWGHVDHPQIRAPHNLQLIICSKLQPLRLGNR
jgi:hypothetical protein